MSVRSGQLGLLDLRRAVVRTGLALAVAVLVSALLHLLRAPRSLALLGGGDSGGLLLIALIWSNIALNDAQQTRARAAAEDPGRTAVYVLVLLASTASLLVSTVLVRGAKSAHDLEKQALVTLCLLAVALSWTLTHTAFALRYAHLFYREDEEGEGGIDFAGGKRPDYFDFAYFAFTVGMCFQVSDTSVTSRQIRRAVLLQSTMAFVYNTVILAFVLNLAFSLAG
jgi:uncharacterized membrane protein